MAYVGVVNVGIGKRLEEEKEVFGRGSKKAKAVWENPQ